MSIDVVFVGHAVQLGKVIKGLMVDDTRIELEIGSGAPRFQSNTLAL